MALAFLGPPISLLCGVLIGGYLYHLAYQRKGPVADFQSAYRAFRKRKEPSTEPEKKPSVVSPMKL